MKRVHVAAAVIRGTDGKILIARRADTQHQGGLWEFPGGKVEAHEMPAESLVRELAEELGILVDAGDCVPAAFAEGSAADGQAGIVVLLYSVSAWQGEPAAREGGAIGWFTPDEARGLPKPPLDVVLAASLLAKSACAGDMGLAKPRRGA